MHVKWRTTLQAAITAVLGAGLIWALALFIGVGAASATPGTCGSGLASSGTTLASGAELTAGQCLISPSGQYELIMQSDGNLVLYYVASSKAYPLWATHTVGNTGDHVVLQTDGNLVVYSSGGTGLWYANSYGNPGATLALQDDGNLVIYSTTSTAVWATNTTGASTCVVQTAIDAVHQGLITPGGCLMSANHKFELLMQPDGNLVLYEYLSGLNQAIWASNTSGNPGAFARLQANGYLGVLNSTNTTQLFYASGSVGTPNPTLVLLDNGNLVLYGTSAGKAKATWSTGTGWYLGSQMVPGETLRPKQMLVSPNGQYQLYMEDAPPNGGTVHAYLLLEQRGVPGAVSCPMRIYGNDGSIQTGTGANNIPIFNDTYPAGSYFTFQKDGNLVVHYPNGIIGASGSNASWAAGTNGKGGTRLILQNDGNLVLYTKSGSAVWGTGSNTNRGTVLCAGADLQPGQYLQSGENFETHVSYLLAMQSDGGLDLYSSKGGAPLWSSGTNGKGSEYAAMQSDGNLVLYPRPGAPAVWATNTAQSTFSNGYYLSVGANRDSSSDADKDWILEINNHISGGGDQFVWYADYKHTGSTKNPDVAGGGDLAKIWFQIFKFALM